MERTILIPTDLHVGSLNALKSCLADSTTGRFRIVLLHAMHAPSGISDLLFYSPRRALDTQMSAAFREALSILKNRFEQRIASMEILPFHGITQTAFEHFLSGLHVDEIHISLNYEMRLSDRAIDPLPFIQRSTIPVVEHGGRTTQASPDRHGVDHLQLLFER
ncbi:MAG: hypothetical protein JNM62_04460 [Flavobacteriales bacterium]|nr:hypothetical protein [Flavobacteriales bacterium]